ncbi:MAG: hypothetical protein ABEH58_00340, partial [Haloplanus sp.]
MSDATIQRGDDATGADDGPARPPEERRIRRALTQIRREGWKVAAIYAVIDSALATLAVNLAATVLGGVPRLPDRLPLPRALRETAGMTLAEPTVSSAAAVGVAIGL